MSTDKRSRQKANRAAGIAAAEAEFQHNRTRKRIFTYGGIGVVLILSLVVINILSGDDSSTVAAPTATTASIAPPATTAAGSDTDAGSGTTDGASDQCPAVDGSSPRRIDFDAPQPSCIAAGANYTAVFDTSEGEVRVELDAESTPGTAQRVTLQHLALEVRQQPADE